MHGTTTSHARRGSAPRPRDAASPVLVGLLALALVAAALAARPGAARAADDAGTPWLCRPDVTPNPCDEGLATTVIGADGARRVEDPGRDPDRPVDCFYVYPTASDQPGPNAEPRVEEPIVGVARNQAARFSQVCRVWAPLYRQATVPALLSRRAGGRAFETAYQSLHDAWDDYLAHHNDGRGVVLIGHSQGTAMLRALIRDEIDDRPDERDRLVSAVLLGFNVAVERGRRTGGDFDHVPTCARDGEIGCAIAFSTYDEPPPADALFGRPTPSGLPAGRSPDGDDGWARLALPAGRRYQVACTNPADLAGNRQAEVEPLFRSQAFGGLVGLTASQAYGGAPPQAGTPWVRTADRYTEACEETDGANVLRLRPVGTARDFTPAPDRTWGLHILDVNLPLGDLVRRVREQSAAYVAAGRTTLRVSRGHPRVQRTDVGVRVRMVLGCQGPAVCQGRLRVRSVGRGPRTLAEGGYRLAGGERKAVRLPTTAEGRRRFARASRRLRVRVVAAYGPDRRRTTSATRVVRTVPPAR